MPRQPLSNRYRHRTRLTIEEIRNQSNRDGSIAAIGCLWLLVLFAVAVLSTPIPA